MEKKMWKRVSQRPIGFWLGSSSFLFFFLILRRVSYDKDQSQGRSSFLQEMRCDCCYTVHRWVVPGT